MLSLCVFVCGCGMVSVRSYENPGESTKPFVA